MFQMGVGKKHVKKPRGAKQQGEAGPPRVIQPLLLDCEAGNEGRQMCMGTRSCAWQHMENSQCLCDGWMGGWVDGWMDG